MEVFSYDGVIIKQSSCCLDLGRVNDALPLVLLPNLNRYSGCVLGGRDLSQLDPELG